MSRYVYMYMCVCVFTVILYLPKGSILIMLQSVSLCGKAIKGIPLLLMSAQVLPGGSSFQVWAYTHSGTHTYTHMHILTDKQTASGAKQRCNLLSKNYFDFDLMLQAVVVDIYFWHTHRQTHTHTWQVYTYAKVKLHTHTRRHAHLPRLTQIAAAGNFGFVLPKQRLPSFLFLFLYTLFVSNCSWPQAPITHTHTHKQVFVAAFYGFANLMNTFGKLQKLFHIACARQKNKTEEGHSAGKGRARGEQKGRQRELGSWKQGKHCCLR